MIVVVTCLTFPDVIHKVQDVRQFVGLVPDENLKFMAQWKDIPSECLKRRVH